MYPRDDWEMGREIGAKEPGLQLPYMLQMGVGAFDKGDSRGNRVDSECAMVLRDGELAPLSPYAPSPVD